MSLFPLGRVPSCVCGGWPAIIYNGHFEQPHSTGLSSSSVNEDPSVHWNMIFRRLVLVGAQQSPPLQDPLHSTRGTLILEVQDV